MDTIWQDIRYATRMLSKKPGFTAVAVLSLGLGIGANTTIFTLVKAVFLQSVPVQDPSRVVAFFSDAQNKNGLTQYLGSSYHNLKDYREKNDVFSGLSIAMGTGAELDISGTQIGVFAELVNWDFFDIVGVHPSIGRGFLPEEDQTPGAHPVVVLSHAIWNRQFGANPKLIGQTIRVSSQDYTVIGVMPEQFHDVGQLGSPDMFIPIMMHDQILTGPSKEYFFWRRFRMAPAVARLKPGVTLARAAAAMRLLGDELEKEYPNDNGGRNNMMVPFDQTNIPPQQRSVFLLAGTLMMSIVGVVLLIACANVANFLLTRATQRRRELAVRLSLGASRARLIRQLLTESLLLGLVGCGAGVLIGHWLERLILGLWPGGPPRNLDFTMDLRVLGFTVALSLVATMIFGLVPALQASKPSQMASLRDRSDAPAGSTHWYGLRGVLVMMQVALSLIALVGAGLFVHSMRNAQNVDPGFEVKHEMVLLLNVGNAHYTQAHGEQYYKEVVDRVGALPMATGASLSDDAPFGGSLAFTIIPEGSDYNDPRNGRTTPMAAVGPDFFKVDGIGFVRGRDFTDHDDAQSMRVAIINEAMAKQMWPDEDPIGKRFRILGQTTDIQTVGIVKNGEVCDAR